MRNIKRKRYFIWWFLLPGILMDTFFMAFPLFRSISLSFYSGPGIVPKDFVGFQNFIDLFTKFPFKERFFNALLNNAKFFIFVWIFQNISGFIIAILVTRKFKGSKFFRRVTFLPTTLSVLIAGFLFSIFLNPVWGFVDKILKNIGLDFLIRSWLGDQKIALIIISLVLTWQYMGIPILFFTAAIEGINKDLIEAANIDGAGTLGIIRYIVLPLTLPVIGLITILTFIGNFTEFDLIFAMAHTTGDPAFATDLLGTLFYRAAFFPPGYYGWGMGMGATVATMMFIIILIGVLLWLFLFNKMKRNSE